MSGPRLLVILAAIALRGQVLRAPAGLPEPSNPPDNPWSAAKANLGRYLFYDRRLSVNGTESCASCHRQELAFTDGRGRAMGASGQRHPRGALSLVNAAWNPVLSWSDPTVISLEEQALRPMMSRSPVELGFGFVESRFLALARTDPFYSRLFRMAFPGESAPWTTRNITRALASFERTIVSRGSPWDRFHFDGDEGAISEAAKRGEVLFFMDGGPGCFRCHAGVNFSGGFHNTGLYNVRGAFTYPASDLGLSAFTRRSEDLGKFTAPTLRNIAVTAPYMHDGSIATLEEVLDHYSAGGRTIAHGPLAGVGRLNPHKDPLVHGFRMTARNKADLLAFLESLTDEELLHRRELSDPWIETARK